MANSGDSTKYFIFFDPYRERMTKAVVIVVITEKEFVRLEKFRDELDNGIVPSSVEKLIWGDDNGIYDRVPLIDDGNSIVLPLV